MQRYQLVVGSTIAGIAGVLAFPTHSAKLAIPSTNTSGTSSGGGSASNTGANNAGAANAGSSGASSGSASSSGSSNVSSSKSATSSVEPYPFGELAVKVTVNGSKITNIAITTLNETDGRSVSIDQYAIPQLEQQVISANSVNINGVSGATFTSQAFVNAVGSALQKLGFQA